jgi:hypothetical protein
MTDFSSKCVYVKGTIITPRILLDADRKLIDIKGKAIQEPTNQVLDEVCKWIDKNQISFSDGGSVNIYMEYFNTIASKQLLDIFKRVESLSRKGKPITINWAHEEDDEDLLEAGEDYQAIINAPVRIVSLKEPESEDETYYESDDRATVPQPIILDINKELLKYIAKHPEALYDISPRKFEELIADIIKDMGFDVELTKMTRDGGRDIVAHVRNKLTSMLMYVECKHFAKDRPVGVDIIRQVIGVKELYKPNKSLIVTSSFFTKDALREKSLIDSQLDLKDHKDIKNWLGRYH